MKILLTFIALGIIIGSAIFLYRLAQTQATYEGLPTVACQDYTKPLVEQFTFSIHIMINGKDFPLDKTIGHDYGNCLHDIFVNDSSGKVFVHSNDIETFTLGQLFDVWHKTFSNQQIFNYQATSEHIIQVFVNSKQAKTFRAIPLLPNENIEVVYK